MTTQRESIALQAETTQPADTPPLGVYDRHAATRQAIEARIICTWKTPREEVRRLLLLPGMTAQELVYLAAKIWPKLALDTLRRRAEWLVRHADWADDETFFRQCAQETRAPAKSPRTTNTPYASDTYQRTSSARPGDGPTLGESAAAWLIGAVPTTPLPVLVALVEVIDVLQQELIDAYARILDRAPTKKTTTDNMLGRFEGTSKRLSRQQRAWRHLNLPDGRPSLALSYLVFGFGGEAGQTRRKTHDIRVGLLNNWKYSVAGPPDAIFAPGEIPAESVPALVAQLWARWVAQISVELVPTFVPTFEPEPEPEMSMV